MSTNKTLGDAGLGELIDILKNELANAGSSVPTITIALNQVRGQDPLQIELTQAQYDALAASQAAVVDGTALGITWLISMFKVSENDTYINFEATFYNWGSGTDELVGDSDAYQFNVVKSTKRLTRYEGKFYAIPTVTITEDNIDQTTGDITLTSAQRAILDNHFIVQFDASIAGYPVVQMYKARGNYDGADEVTFSSVPDAAGTWSYTVLYVDGSNVVEVITREVLSAEFYPYEADSPVSCDTVRIAVSGGDGNAQVSNIVSGSTLAGESIRTFINAHLPIRINGALCHYMDENTTTNIVRYFTATMNGALVHLNIIEINTYSWVVTFNQVDVEASPNIDLDLTANTCFTLDATAFASLVSTHTATVASPVFTGLSNAYEFVTIKVTVYTSPNTSTNYNVKLCRNDTNKYSGLFFIEDSSHLYELTLYYNGTSVYLRCATVY